MIRQLCPHCLAAVELPADAAGSAAPCPACGQPIAVPAGYVPTVVPASSLPPPVEPPADAPAPPPGFVPPRPSAVGEVRPAVAADASGSAAPGWLAWLPAAALTVALLLTLFAWVGSFPGGVRVYTQTPWQAAVGTFSTAILPDGLTDDEAALRKATHTDWWLLPYFPVLLAAVALAWAERLVPDPAALPRRVAGGWPHRFALLAGLATLALLLVGLQTWQGYGLEAAARRVAADAFAEERAAADGNQNKLTRVAVKTGREENRIGVRGATALDLAVLAHVLAAGGAAGGWWLHRRGDRPVPRLVLSY